MSLVVKQEYFALINKMNLSNKFSNQETNIYFFIRNITHERVGLFASISNYQRILLCEKYRNRWKGSDLSGFYELEKFISHLLNKEEFENSILTSKIVSHIFELSD